MIKAEVNITGTVRRSASIRTDRSNHPYVSFLMSVSIPDGSSTKDIHVFVSLPQAQQSDLALYTEDRRVTVSGTMDIRRKDGGLGFYLTARLVTVENVPTLDAISGTLSFRGYLKKENIFEERTSKNGRPYLLFSAYSSEKVGNDFANTWVTFLRFPAKNATIESVKPECLRPHAHVDITGDLRISFYKDAPSLSCIVKEMAEYINNS